MDVVRPNNNKKKCSQVPGEAASLQHVGCVKYFVLNSRFCLDRCLCVYLFSSPACFAKVAFACLGQ